MTIKRYLCAVVVLLCSLWATPSCASDTLSLEVYLDVISQHYPLIKKANLYDGFIDAYDLKGKGAFDPKLSSDFQTKDFDGTDYFNVWQTELKVPTKLPIDLAVGYERNNGDFLNEQNTVPQNGLVYGTLNLNLIRGLMFDEQRYNLQIMELKGVKGQIEKELLIREVLYSAVGAYLEWSAAQNENDILRAYQAAQIDRHKNTIQLVINGDKPAIDSIESKLYINTAAKMFLESTQSLQIKRQKAALFLWNENGAALEIVDTVSPDMIIEVIDYISQLSLMISPDFNNDPLIKKLDNQISQIEMDNRLERESLKPQLDLKYNTLLSLGKDAFSPSYALNDYKYGISFELPILNRKTKGEIQLNSIMIEQNKMDRSQYQQSLLMKYDNVILARDFQLQILDVAQEKIDNSQSLLNAESLKFNLGESSVFMVNQRERKLYDARVEQVRTYFKLGKTLSEMYYLSLGQD